MFCTSIAPVMYHARSQGTSSQGTNCNHCAEVGLQEVPQVYAACGRGARSTLRMLRPGIAVAEVAVTELPARPTAVWTVRKTQEDAYDDLIVISFGDDKATLVLRVGDTVQEVNDSGLEGKTATLGVQLLANNSTLQARPRAHPAQLRLYLRLQLLQRRRLLSAYCSPFSIRVNRQQFCESAGSSRGPATAEPRAAHQQVGAARAAHRCRVRDQHAAGGDRAARRRPRLLRAQPERATAGGGEEGGTRRRVVPRDCAGAAALATSLRAYRITSLFARLLRSNV